MRRPIGFARRHRCHAGPAANDEGFVCAPNLAPGRDSSEALPALRVSDPLLGCIAAACRTSMVCAGALILSRDDRRGAHCEARSATRPRGRATSRPSCDWRTSPASKRWTLDAERRLSLLTALEDLGASTAAAGVGLTEPALAEEIRALEATLAIASLKGPRRSRRRRVPPRPELTDGALALLCRAV